MLADVKLHMRVAEEKRHLEIHMCGGDGTSQPWVLGIRAVRVLLFLGSAYRHHHAIIIMPQVTHSRLSWLKITLRYPTQNQ
jgi:hypothetical protein